MINYKSSTEDIAFMLNHVSGAQNLPDYDPDLAVEIIDGAGRFIEREISPLDVIGDQVGACLQDGRVVMPPEFVQAYQQYCEAGWPSLTADPEHGGQGLGHVFGGALADMLAGGCISYEMVLSLGQGAMRTLAAKGSDSQKNAYLPKLISGEWLASMCLTEPGAGSDLGQIRTIAELQNDGSYHLSGSKIFISGGDQNMTNNILHLVLARTPDAPKGVKGLSLFLALAELPGGERNAISTVALEHKMGMHASPTCQLAFDGAKAELIGEEGQGLAAMFTMMNAERLDVSLQAVGQMDAALQRAMAHALERKQGRQAHSAELAVIAEHGDVQSMLLTMNAYLQGSRAMVYRTMVLLDELEQGKGSQALIDLLTPVCKAFATDAVNEVASLGVQIHGGYGFCKEYRAEQVMRDCRIMSIYEGTNGILAANLAGRTLRNNEAVTAFEALIADGQPSAALFQALGAWKEAAIHVPFMRDGSMAASAFMRLTGLVYFGHMWGQIVQVAEQSRKSDLLIATEGFVETQILPQSAYLLQRIKNAPSAYPIGLFS